MKILKISKKVKKAKLNIKKCSGGGWTISLVKPIDNYFEYESMDIPENIEIENNELV